MDLLRRFRSKRSCDARKRRSGAALLEFALVLPIFLLLLLGMLEFSTLFFVRHTMLHAAREAARSYSINEFNSTESEQLAADSLAGINANFTVEASPQESADVERWVEIRVPIGEASLGDPLSVLGVQDLTVRVTMRREEK
jgi:Flp pilus assembly protein TadG